MKSNVLLRKPNRKFLIGATLAVLAVLHFTFSRFIAIEIEKDSTEIEAVNLQPAQAVVKPEPIAPKIAAENKPEVPEVIKTAEPIASVRKVQPESEAKREMVKEPPIVKKKQATRETRAERLRRTEKILTGV